MWKLTIEDDEGKPTSLPLVHDEYTLGRGETNAIRLTDRNVSRKHATLKKNGVGWVLSDLQSYNGTFVNNERVVGERDVSSGDVMMVGDYRLILTDETIAPGADPSRPTGPVLPVQYRPNRLVIVVGPGPGTEFPLDKDNFTIGRSEEATISINHSSVSRIHAELIALGGGRFEIIDKGSANGIRVNGVELKRGILEAGDALELGDVRLRFVGAGKVFRSNADQSQALPVVPVGANGEPAPAGGLGTGKIVGILLGVVAVIVVVVFALLGSGKTNAGSGSGRGSGHVVTPGSADDNGPELLKEAQKLLDGGDTEGAHNKVQDIPEGSAAFDDPGVRKVENAWADWIFQKVDEAKTNDEKRALLKQIPPDIYVDKERREKALTLMGTLPPEPPPTPVGVPGVGVGAGPGPSPATSATSEPTTTSSKTAGPATSSSGGAPTGAFDEAAIRRGLEGKVWSGKASVEEIRMLKAICSHQGDRACRDRANAMLKAKLEQQGK